MNVAIRKTHQNCEECDKEVDKAVDMILEDTQRVHPQGVWMATSSDSDHVVHYNIPKNFENHSATAMVSDYVVVLGYSQE